MRRYIALVETNPGAGLTARMPDFPGVRAIAETLDTLRDRLADDLAANIAAMDKARQTLPEPSSFDALMADPRYRNCAAFLVWTKDATAALPAETRPDNSLGVNANDEWPEADA